MAMPTKRKGAVMKEELAEWLFSVWLFTLLFLVFLAPFVTVGMLIAYVWGMV
jgi:hypothetical protein